MNIKTAIARLEAETAELAELKRKIEEHNDECDRLCSVKTDCYKAMRARRCHDCPKDWRIDL